MSHSNGKKVLLFSLVLILSCSSSKHLLKESSSQPHWLAHVLVLPFIDIKDLTLDDVDLCPHCEEYTHPIQIFGKPGTSFKEMVTNQLLSDPRVRIQWSEEAEETVTINDIKTILRGTIPQKLNAVPWDFMITGLVLRYQRRVGSAYATDVPASVAFHIFIFSRKDRGKNVVKLVSKTQTSLTENLLDLKTFLSASGRWLTVDELARLLVKWTLEEWQP